MARPREFDSDTVLEKATDVFWQHGFEGASMPDLLDGMGLTRGSLYKAFKDKHSLFLLVLNRYEQIIVGQAVDHLSTGSSTDGIARIEALFDTITNDVASGDTRGCLLCSAAAGPSSYDPDIAAAVNQGLDKMHEGFSAALASTDIPSEDQSSLADFLVTQYVGLRVMARSVEPLNALTRASGAVATFLQRF